MTSDSTRMLAVVPDPASPELARTLDLAGYSWKSVASAGDASESEPDGGWAGVIVDATEDIDGAWSFLRALRKQHTDPAPVLELLPTPGLPDIGSLPYGTLLLAQQHIEADPDRPLLAYGPHLLALYRVQLAYGKYDEGRVAACLAALLAAPVTESYADAAFFLASMQRWLSATPPTPTMPQSPSPKKRRPAARSWPNALAACSAWMRRRAGACSTTTPP